MRGPDVTKILHDLNLVAPLVLVGAGNMGGALLDGWLAKGLSGSAVTVVDPGLPDERHRQFVEQGIEVSASVSGQLSNCRTLVLAVKPQLMSPLLLELVGKLSGQCLVISVAAGTTVETFKASLGVDQPIVRVMPNTPAMVGAGMSVGFCNSHVSEQQIAHAHSLMAAVGDVAWIDDEALMDAVTGVSGSGPAYVFYLAEAMTVAGVAAGLPERLAAQLARQTVIGGGALLASSAEPASVLRENVTSPNGTTAAALEVLMADNGLSALMTRAIAAAAARSRELSK